MSKGAKNFYQKIAWICGGGLLVALIIFWVIIPLIEFWQKPAYLDILVPAEAKVEIDGQEYRNAVYEMEPGSYTATVRLGDLPPEVIEMNLTKNVTTGLYLNWSESGGWQYLTAEELAHRQAIGEITPLYLSICGTPAKRTNCNAVVINYDRVPECQNQECLVINGRGAEMTDEVLTAVRDKLTENGYNLDDYRYVYVQNDNR